MECEKCKVEFIYVELCPLHTAAGDLLKAAKEALDVLDALEYYDEARDMLREAITKTEPNDPQA